MNNIAQTKQGLIEYRDVGQSEHRAVVLILNGGHTNCNSPLGHEQLFLDMGCRLIIPSRPGYGKTPASTGRIAERFADALGGLLDNLHIEQAVVVGISAAGPTTLQLASRRPDLVSKVILQNAVTGGRFASLTTRLGAYLIFNPWIERWTWAAFRAFARLAPMSALRSMMRSLTLLNPAHVVATMSREQRQSTLAFLLASRSGSGFLHDLHHRCGNLQLVSAPTLIIQSKYDGAVDASHATYAADHIRNAELFVSPAESHLLWFSPHNAAIEERIRSFLEAEQVQL